jgi:UDP-glucose 4-epimerase
MSRVLVTGGAGFIGSNVIKLLTSEGYDVVVLDNLSSGYERNLGPFKQVSLQVGDVRDAETVARVMEDVEIVFHLAASVGNVKSIEQPVEDSEINVIGTIRVLEAARRAGVKKIVCSSSAAIFGELQRLPIDEGHPTEPDSPYGVSKLAEEKQCLAFGRIYGLDAICLRYFNVYGVNQRYDAYGNVIPIFADRLLRRKPLTIYGDGEQTRDFVSVDDVARANLLAARSRGVSGAFNIASGVATTINRLASMMSEMSDSEITIEHTEARKGEVRDSQADISAARATLGYEPRVALAPGLLEYMNWFRSEFAGA